MAYSGYLFKFGNFTFPNKYILWDSFDINPNQRQDLDSYTDANGLTHRNAISHTKTQIQFVTKKLPESKMKTIMDNMVKNYKNKKERDANCTYYDTEHFKYETGHFYLDPSLQMRLLGLKDGELWFNQITWLFIEY